MTSNSVDFFATLGRKPGPFNCKTFKSVWSDNNEVLSPSEIWNDAITDICVLTIGIYMKMPYFKVSCLKHVPCFR